MFCHSWEKVAMTWWYIDFSGNGFTLFRKELVVGESRYRAAGQVISLRSRLTRQHWTHCVGGCFSGHNELNPGGVPCAFCLH